MVTLAIVIVLCTPADHPGESRCSPSHAAVDGSRMRARIRKHNRLSITKCCIATAAHFLLIATSVLAGEKSLPLADRIAWQIALDRVGFSPGLIDGKIGPKTRLATREAQRVLGLPQSGELDAATREKLKVNPQSAFAPYIITASDMGSVGPTAAEWEAKSKLPRLGYESLDVALAERFHCSVGLLRTLNPGADINAYQAGDRIIAPNIEMNPEKATATRLILDLSEKTIRALDAQNRLVALLHCSIAAKVEKRPRGTAKIKVITRDPTYSFDPKMWPEVKNVKRKLLIPAGPRNPVGKCWIGLSLPGYGIHGTPKPELIGKTGSHGCIRLTNWDAVRLGGMVRVGTPVEFLE